MNEQEKEIWRDEVFRKAVEALARHNSDAVQTEQRMRLELALSQQQAQRAHAQAVWMAQQQQAALLPSSIGALGRIMLHNKQMNARVQEAPTQPGPPNPNAPPPRVTVQDIFDYHAEKDRTAIPIRSVTDPH